MGLQARIALIILVSCGADVTPEIFYLFCGISCPPRCHQDDVMPLSPLSTWPRPANGEWDSCTRRAAGIRRSRFGCDFSLG